MSVLGKNHKITVLHDNPPLTGKKHFLVSMISPESRQKHQVYGMKIHDVCEDYSEAEQLAQYYNSMDPVFDVLIGTVGKWSPWVFNFDDVTPKYADEQLNNLVTAHRGQANIQDRQFIDHVNRHKTEVAQVSSKEFQEAKMIEKKETAVQLLFKIKQLELIISRRNEELSSLQCIYSENYTDEEREHASTLEGNFPLTEPSITQYKEIIEVQEEIMEEQESVVENSESYLKRTGKLSIHEEIPTTTTTTTAPATQPVRFRKRTIEELKNEILARRL